MSLPNPLAAWRRLLHRHDWVYHSKGKVATVRLPDGLWHAIDGSFSSNGPVYESYYYWRECLCSTVAEGKLQEQMPRFSVSKVLSPWPP